MLINSVPDGLKIAGTEYKIHTDFSVWIEFEKLLSDESENAHKTISDIKNLIFCDKQPPQRADEKTVNKILWFYRCGKKLQKSSHTSEKEIFSYDYDDGYIFSAFLEQYHIDLEQTKLHWWKFHALMLSLSDSTEFVKIMGYRSVEINSKMTASQKAFYQKMKKQYKLPLKKEVQKQISSIEDALINGETIDNLL
ncbi:bacteriophage Gp15 family protein [uncultured Ruminococcus sp.]|uniref:bacteriophage Gp15 family protein n=1 Tax=Ruminococcus sp. TaxID=41978 RepID=UPI0026713AC8|nr:bacteriophage Gp15 family protein [uncultured Ruminococcus sp.]